MKTIICFAICLAVGCSGETSAPSGHEEEAEAETTAETPPETTAETPPETEPSAEAETAGSPIQAPATAEAAQEPSAEVPERERVAQAAPTTHEGATGTSAPLPPATPVSTVEATEDHGWDDLLHSVRTDVAVSSAYRDDERQVRKLYDGNLESAWNSATHEATDTRGDTISIRLPESVRVEAIDIIAGYAKLQGDSDLFTQNRRVTKIRITNGAQRVEASLDPGVRGFQRVPFASGGGDIRVYLLEWADGTRADWRELVVSELRVLGHKNDAPAAARPRPWLFELPVTATELLADGSTVITDDILHLPMDDEDLPEFSRLGRLHYGHMRENVGTANLRLRGGKCHVVLGALIRKDMTANAYDGESVSFMERGNEAPAATLNREGIFVVGAPNAFCPESGSTETITITSPHASYYAVAIYEVDGLAETGRVPTRALQEERAEEERERREDEAFEATMAREEAMQERDGSGSGSGPSILERDEGELHLTELVLAESMDGRTPVHAGDRFSKTNGERVYCFFRLVNPEGEATNVSLAWEDENGRSRRDPTAIDVPARRGFAHYRYTTLSWRRPGRYQCVVRDNDSTVIGRYPFTVTE